MLLALLALLALAAAGGGCAAPGADVHLAPLYGRFAAAGGGRSSEALGGLYQRRTQARDGALSKLTIGPFWSHDRYPNGDWSSRYLVPLGFTSHRQEEGRATSWLFPLYVWTRGPQADGSTEWRLAALPGFLMKSNSVTGRQMGWFPLFGRFEDVLTYERVVFVLWPLFVYAERNDSVSYHFLYPILGWTRGGGERSHHLWPLYGRARIEDRYDRTYLLWPFFHLVRNALGGGGEEPETTWMLFPLLGHTQRGTYQAWTWLWPLFGYAWDPRSGFWAWDGPFFLVRIQRGPDDVRRTRFWPIWSRLETADLQATSWLWPIVHLRHEVNGTSERESAWVVPVWQSWDQVDHATGAEAGWRKLFPFFQLERRDAWERGSFPTLDPFWRNDVVDRHFAWTWKLWEWEREGELRRERSWLGLWRRERDAGEDRRSLAGLWSARTYRRDGRRVRETSLLFGLLRWRVTEDEGFDMLPAAFPGPGWPAERILPEDLPPR